MTLVSGQIVRFASAAAADKRTLVCSRRGICWRIPAEPVRRRYARRRRAGNQGASRPAARHVHHPRARRRHGARHIQAAPGLWPGRRRSRRGRRDRRGRPLTFPRSWPSTGTCPPRHPACYRPYAPSLALRHGRFPRYRAGPPVPRRSHVDDGAKQGLAPHPHPRPRREQLVTDATSAIQRLRQEAALAAADRCAWQDLTTNWPPSSTTIPGWPRCPRIVAPPSSNTTAPSSPDICSRCPG